MNIKSYLSLIIILLTVSLSQNSLFAQSRQVDLELIEAGRVGDINKIKELLKAGANINAKDNYGRTVLITALDHIEIVKELLEYAKENLNSKQFKEFVNAITKHEGRTALIYASMHRSVEVVKELLRAGADVDIKDNNGLTALILASVNHHPVEKKVEVVKELLRAGANVNAKGNNGQTALSLASYHGHAGIVKELLRAGADVDIKDTEGYTPLIDASILANIEIVKDLLRAGADINAISSDGYTALKWASKNHQIEVVNLLTAISKAEESKEQEEFVKQSDDIKDILISRWINLYKKNRNKLLIDRLKMAELVAKQTKKEEIRKLLSNLDISKPEKFTDIIIKTIL